jgi:hypothetical protein
MKKKPDKKMLGPTLQAFELVPVTGPVDIATPGKLGAWRWPQQRPRIP